MRIQLRKIPSFLKSRILFVLLVSGLIAVGVVVGHSKTSQALTDVQCTRNYAQAVNYNNAVNTKTGQVIIDAWDGGDSRGPINSWNEPGYHYQVFRFSVRGDANAPADSRIRSNQCNVDSFAYPGFRDYGSETVRALDLGYNSQSPVAAYLGKPDQAPGGPYWSQFQRTTLTSDDPVTHQQTDGNHSAFVDDGGRAIIQNTQVWCRSINFGVIGDCPSPNQAALGNNFKGAGFLFRGEAGQQYPDPDITNVIGCNGGCNETTNTLRDFTVRMDGYQTKNNGFEASFYVTTKTQLKTNPPPQNVNITGRVYASDDGHGFGNMSIFGCGSATTTNPDGTFTMTVPAGSGFCLRVASGDPGGYSNLKLSPAGEGYGPGGNSYENQVAGQFTPNGYDRTSDGGYDFTYDKFIAQPPNRPTASVSGPAVIHLGSSGNYTAHADDPNGNLTDMEIVVVPYGQESNMGAWTYLSNTGCSGAACDSSGGWTPGALGNYSVFVQAEDASNYICAGYPGAWFNLYGSLGFDPGQVSDCGPNSRINVVVDRTPPPRPTGTVSGPTQITIGDSGTYQGDASEPGGSLGGTRVLVAPFGSEADLNSWTTISSNGCSGANCSSSGTWTPVTLGQYTVIVEADDNNDFTCSGYPARWQLTYLSLGLPLGNISDCGPNSRMTVDVVAPIVGSGGVQPSITASADCSAISGNAVDQDAPWVQIDVELLKDGQPVTTIPTDGGHNFSYSTQSFASYSSYQLTVIADGVDSSGNRAGPDSDPQTFTVPACAQPPVCGSAAQTVPGQPETSTPFDMTVGVTYSVGSPPTAPNYKLHVNTDWGYNQDITYTSDNTHASGTVTGQSVSPPGAHSITVTFTGPNVNVSCPYTVNVGDKPYVKVFGGDVVAGSSFLGAGGVCPTNPRAGVIGYNNSKPSAAAGGSAAQFAVTALNTITEFGSAAGRGSDPTQPKGLTFANTTAGAAFGGNFDTKSCVPDYFNNLPAIFSLAATTLPQNTYPNQPAVGLDNGQNHKVIYKYDGDVYINGSIIYTGQGGARTDIRDIPLFYLVVRGNIYIENTVTQLDGVYIAQPRSDGTGGTIYTCAVASGSLAAPVSADKLYDPPTATGGCNSKLTINGSFIANQVKFLRTNGSLRQSTNTEAPGSSTIAEEFDYSPEIYLATPPPSQNNVYDAITSLPPVL